MQQDSKKGRPYFCNFLVSTTKKGKISIQSRYHWAGIVLKQQAVTSNNLFFSESFPATTTPPSYQHTQSPVKFFTDKSL